MEEALQTEQLDQPEQTTTEAPQAAPELVDIDSMQKFKFQGREWTPQELRNSYLMHSTFTKKTQALAEERKFYDNLNYDLKKVQGDPSLAEQFKKIYPAKYHDYLEYVTQKAVQQQDQPKANIDPAFMDRFTRVETELRDSKIKAINAELDNKFSLLSKKYQFADEEAVVARAQSLIDQGETLTEKVWDNLWKSVHDRNQKLAEQYYNGKINKQKDANAKSKDTPSGGGIPGKAPARPRSIKEAAKLAEQQGIFNNV